jgi:hypothetical protein
MGREVRRVPQNWVHPRNPRTVEYIPLLEGPFSERLTEWEAGKLLWGLGCQRALDASYEELYGDRPRQEDYMPEWPEEKKTHLQMYETCSEGTPISPVMKTPEELAHWLADNKASACGKETATYEQWLCAIHEGWVPSGVCVSPM